MAKQKENVPDVKFITSFALAVTDIEESVKHLQITVCQEVESKKFQCFFDVVDPSRVFAVHKEDV